MKNDLKTSLRTVSPTEISENRHRLNVKRKTDILYTTTILQLFSDIGHNMTVGGAKPSSTAIIRTIIKNKCT